MVSSLRRLAGLALFSTVLLAGARAAQDFSTPYYFTAIAGISTADLNKENATAASLNRPQAVAVAADGTLYIADAGDFTIRRVTPAGTSTVLAGTAGSSGIADGTGAAARFRNPRGIAVDTSGNVYVSEPNDHIIRKITPAGVVTTLAGTAGSSGSTDGTGAAARFNTPWGLAVGPAGDLFVAETGNYTIRKVTPAGVVTTFAGQAGSRGFADGPATSARFASVYHLTVNPAGTLFLPDGGNNLVRKISATGEVSTLAGTLGSPGQSDGVGSAARFASSLSGIALDSNGNVFVAESDRGVLRKISPAGEVTTPTFSFPPGSNLLDPQGLGADGSGNIYVADPILKVVYRIAANGMAGIAAGNGQLDANGYADGTGKAARFREPSGIAVDAGGNVYVADTGNQVIRKITTAGVVTTLVGSAGASGATDGAGSAARFKGPADLAIDGAGNLYAADQGNGAIRKITAAGAVTTLAAHAGTDLGIDGAGNLYAPNTDRILKISPAGASATFAAMNFTVPADAAVDATGNVFVADPYQRIIWKITPAGGASVFAGQPNTGGSNDGAGNQASFNWPTSLALDATGNLFVVDNDAIRKITPAGVVSTLAGSGAAATIPAANQDQVTLYLPGGIAVDAAGAVYITDGPVIRKGMRAGAPAITTQPQGTSVTAGNTAQFSVTATGTALTYQWYFNGGILAGATASTFSLSSARSADAGDYTVVVTNAIGSVTSSKASLTVSAAPTTPTPPSSGGGGGGGGGAPSTWFLLALLTLGGVQRLRGTRSGTD